MKDTFISTTRESFTEAIQRGNNWLKSLFEAGYKEKIIKEYSYFFASGDKEKGLFIIRSVSKVISHKSEMSS